MPRRLAQHGPSAGQVDVYDYVADGVYPLRTALGITTQVELDPAEEILDFSTGFSSGWDLTRRGNVFYLRPRGSDVDTNMLVRTRTHSYIFELKVVATDWTSLEQVRRAGVQYKVAFRYPADASFAPPAEATPDRGQASRWRRTADTTSTTTRHAPAPAWLVPMNVYEMAASLPAHGHAGGIADGDLPRRVRASPARRRRVRRQYDRGGRRAGGAWDVPLPGRAPRPRGVA